MCQSDFLCQNNVNLNFSCTLHFATKFISFDYLMHLLAKYSIIMIKLILILYELHFTFQLPLLLVTCHDTLGDAYLSDSGNIE